MRVIKGDTRILDHGSYNPIYSSQGSKDDPMAGCFEDSWG